MVASSLRKHRYKNRPEPFIIAAAKLMTDKFRLAPDIAINATMITANNNIIVAVKNGSGMNQGFVVIGVPIK